MGRLYRLDAELGGTQYVKWRTVYRSHAIQIKSKVNSGEPILAQRSGCWGSPEFSRNAGFFLDLTRSGGRAAFACQGRYRPSLPVSAPGR